MKNLLLPFLLIMALFAGSGCVTRPDKMPLQQILSAILPPGFTGSYHLKEQNSLVQFDIDFTGLKKVDGLWTWTGMKYNGHSAVTTTESTLSPQ